MPEEKSEDQGSKPDPQDIADIINHKPFVWMFKRDSTKTKIHHYSKGAWGEIRWDFGFVCGAVMAGPLWLILFTLLFAQTG